MALYVHQHYCPQNHRCPILGVCPTGAITQIGYGLPKIDTAKCIRCGKCVRICGMQAIMDDQQG
jgi:ferredoxin